MATVKRALISCHDKTGLDGLAKALVQAGAELIASGGTAAHLKQQGLPVTTVESFAGISEQLDGRVKTLHPKIHGGILARRDNPEHVKATGPGGLIDVVVVNLYPFESTVQQAGVTLAQAVEQIDIGGVALLRAAAKNFADVAVISSPQQYPAVVAALQQGQGTVPEALTRELSVAAFQLTSRYDALIAAYLGNHKAPESKAALPASATLPLRQHQALRYGENPHQAGAWYVEAGAAAGLGALKQWQGKELSYNNLLDMDAALRCLLEFEAPACAIIKHHSQCGLASAADAQTAYDRAYACDPESAFGGIVGVNRPVDAALAQRLTATFLEVILAPSVTEEARALLAKKTNLRVVTLPWPKAGAGIEWRQLYGAWLGQQADAGPDAGAWKTVSKRAPMAAEQADLKFAWLAAKHALSNGVVIAKDQATLAIGQGQPSRVGSVRAAVQRAGDKARGAVAASDGFFPFPDGLELLGQAGVTAIVQPGGSIKDAEVIAAADRLGIALVVTGVRHFRH